MAEIGDSYVDATYYLARNTGGSSVSDSDRLDDDLLAMSRAFDNECGLAPGTLNSVTEVDLVFDGRGGPRLDFRDDTSRLWLVRDITTIGIDSENDGSYDGHSLTLADAWVAGFPANNATVGKPYAGLEFLTYLSTCNPSEWPKRKRVVKLSGCTLGYATMPVQVQAIVSDWTRELRDKAGAGAAADLERFGESMPLSNGLFHQIQRLKREFNRSLLAVA